MSSALVHVAARQIASTAKTLNDEYDMLRARNLLVIWFSGPQLNRLFIQLASAGAAMALSIIHKGIKCLIVR